jgi:hypothetical protein
MQEMKNWKWYGIRFENDAFMWSLVATNHRRIFPTIHHIGLNRT